MKKIRLLALCLAAVLLLCSCSSPTYKPVASSAEETKTVVTFSAGKKTYKVPFELYRTFFLMLKPSIDGGDSSVWSGAEKETYRAAVNEKILDRLYDIYSVFALCDAIGYDPYSKQADEEVQAFIQVSVDGGFLNDVYLTGYDSYDDYLADLRANYLTYNVQDLLYRYALAEDAVQSYYIGNTSGSYLEDTYLGVLTYPENSLRSFFDEDGTMRVIWLYTPKNIVSTADALTAKVAERQSAMKQIAAEKTDIAARDVAVAEYVIGHSTDPASEVLRGQLISKYNLSRLTYGELLKTAEALAVGEVSEPIEVVTDAFNGYFILYRAEKTDAWFADPANRDALIDAYLMDAFGRLLAEKEEELRASVKLTDDLRNLDLASVSME